MTRSGTARWPWLVGGLLSVVVVWRCESTGATAPRPEPRVERTPDAPGRRALRQRQRARARTLVHRMWRPRPAATHRVTGRVYDVESGAGMPGVAVVFADGVRELREITDDDGHYLIDLPPGRYRPHPAGDSVLALGRAARGPGVAVPILAPPGSSILERSPVVLVDADIDGLDFDVVQSARVRGRVLDRAGRPIAGAVVLAVPEDEPDLLPVGGTNVATADHDGRFELTLAARPHQLTPYHDHYTAADSSILELEPGKEVAPELTMTAGCIVTGRVLRDGEPVGAGRIVRGPSPNSRGFTTARAFDDSGRFVWSTTERATVWLQAFPWHGPTSSPTPIVCREGARHEVVFEIPSDVPALTGTVVAADGSPIAGAFIDVTGVVPRWETVAGRARTDVSGDWEGHGYPAGSELDVVARVPGRGVATTRVTAPAHDLRLRLSGTGALEGRTRGLRDGSFTLEAECTGVLLYGGDTRDRIRVPVRNGRYRVDGVSACAAKVVGRGNGGVTPAFDVTILAGASTTLDLDLSALASAQVHGVVHGADGEPVEGAFVRVLDQSAQVLTDADGRFRIRAAPGAQLLVHARGVATTWQLAADAPSEVDLDLLLDPAHPASAP